MLATLREVLPEKGRAVGAVPGGYGGEVSQEPVAYTDPVEARRYLEETGVDALAVSIGTRHGLHKGPVRLNLPLLEELGQLPVPLVLHRAFIWPQKEHADIIVRFYRPAGYDPENPSTLNVRITLKHTLPRLDLSEVLHSAYEDEALIRLETRKEADILDITGNVTPEQAQAFERIIWDHLGHHVEHFDPRLVGTFLDKAGQSYPLALAQLVIAYYLVKMRELAIERGHLRVA
ncbi:class II fructose-bisphosphate aldolase [Thermus sp. NEB1569]|nr:class II fructose-bisphosphate aldolase [Thermus sp. NEB1569]ULR40309.1 class II fructose-bisphosphate aldolase [Thermus sp. NEB1569]